MHGIAVALLTEDQDHLSALQTRLEATRLGQAVFSHVGFPAGPTDSILRQLQDSRAEVVIVNIPAQDSQRAIRTIELIRATTQQIGIFANGDMTQPASIVASMRAGAGEYLDDSAGFEPLQEALTRFSSARTRSLGGEGKARVFTFISAKGGAGCTTAAVNTAVALQQSHGDLLSVHEFQILVVPSSYPQIRGMFHQASQILRPYFLFAKAFPIINQRGPYLPQINLPW